MGYVNLVIGGITALLFLNFSTNGNPYSSFGFHSVIIILLILLSTALSCLFCWGGSQFIKLKINNAENLEIMNKNIYILTSIAEKFNTEKNNM